MEDIAVQTHRPCVIALCLEGIREVLPSGVRLPSGEGLGTDNLVPVKAFAVDVSDYICIPKVGDESVTYAKTPQKPKNPDRPQATTSEKITSAAEKLNGSTASALKEREEKRGRVKRPTNMLGTNEKSKHVEGGSIVLGN